MLEASFGPRRLGKVGEANLGLAKVKHSVNVLQENITDDPEVCAHNQSPVKTS
jgi:hypothetical protein